MLKGPHPLSTAKGGVGSDVITLNMDHLHINNLSHSNVTNPSTIIKLGVSSTMLNKTVDATASGSGDNSNNKQTMDNNSSFLTEKPHHQQSQRQSNNHNHQQHHHNDHSNNHANNHHQYQVPQVKVTLNGDENLLSSSLPHFVSKPTGSAKPNQRRGSLFHADNRLKKAHANWSTVSKLMSPGNSRRGSSTFNGMLLAPRKSRGGTSFDTFMTRASRRRSSGKVSINARESSGSFSSAAKDTVDYGPTVDKVKCRKKFKLWIHIVTALLKMDMRCKDRMWGSTTSYREQIENVERFSSRCAEEITHYSDFNPNEYKANKQMRMSGRAKEILLKPPEQRTDEEIKYVTIALRGISLIAEYPVRMQKQLAKYGQFECFEAGRPIVKQHHPPWAFYFILFGTVLVAVRPDDVQDAKTVVNLKRGESFGELSIMNGTPRQSTVITFEYSEFLSIDVRTYENLFMVGGSKNINDPDHNAFMESLFFLKQWPRHLLQDNAENVKFLYFSRDAIITKDSNYSDWIIIIKSGSVQVLKKLVKILPTVNVHTGRTTPTPSKLDIHLAFLSNSEDFHRLLELKNNTEINISPATSRCSPSPNLYSYRSPRAVSLTPRIEDINDGETQSNGKTVRSQSAAMIRLTSSPNRMYANSRNRKKSMHSKSAKYVKINSGRNSVQSFSLEEEQEGGEVTIKPPDDLVQTGRRTYVDDLDSGYHKRDRKWTAADRNPMFVHVQTLTKGDVFGLNTHVFTEQPSLCLVSNGCECILIKKKLYFDNCTIEFRTKLRNHLSPYPDDKDLQKDLLTRVNWDSYKQATLSDLLHRQTTKAWI